MAIMDPEATRHEAASESPAELSPSDFQLPTNAKPPFLSWTIRRQIVYFLVFFFLIAGVGYGVFTRVGLQPTCSDGIKNADELGIDCGGACTRVCPNDVQDLQIEWSKVFSARDGSYDAAALVFNPNLSYGLATLHYHFTLFDKSNKLVAEREGNTFVNPGEHVALYEPSIATGNRVPLRAFVQFEDPDYVLPWRRAVLPLRPLLSVDDSKLQGTDHPELMAQVANHSVADALSIQAIAVIFDKDEIPLGIRSNYLDSIKRNDSIPVEFKWSTLDSTSKPTQAQVYPRATAQGIK